MLENKKCKCCRLEKQIEEELCVCKECMQTENGQILAIREYMEKNPKATVEQVCKDLEISYFNIDRLVKSGGVVMIPNEYNDEFEKIKRFLALQPNALRYQLSAATGVSLEIIEKFIDQGRLMDKAGKLLVSKSMGVPQGIQRQRNIRETYRIEGEPNTRKPLQDSNFGKSKLVQDLEKLKKGIDIRNSDEEGR